VVASVNLNSIAWKAPTCGYAPGRGDGEPAAAWCRIDSVETRTTTDPRGGTQTRPAFSFRYLFLVRSQPSSTSIADVSQPIFGFEAHKDQLEPMALRMRVQAWTTLAPEPAVSYCTQYAFGPRSTLARPVWTVDGELSDSPIRDQRDPYHLDVAFTRSVVTFVNWCMSELF
jgi:hypothetical protein